MQKSEGVHGLGCTIRSQKPQRLTSSYISTLEVTVATSDTGTPNNSVRGRVINDICLQSRGLNLGVCAFGPFKPYPVFLGQLLLIVYCVYVLVGTITSESLFAFFH